MTFTKKVKGEGIYELVWVWNGGFMADGCIDTFDIMEASDKDILSIAKKIKRRKG